ncbi:hypothetical protein NLJ89_g10749 [Agrocybe chaxingu]|uniref:CCHC-type domain-containing protein n=1 Tax=Agrocybe chaxingu TaxID=84603 RepID=A0A9W8MRU4_9AGAR|nr:hypothetical protein NLJ89_g10749 [Agrocybe chaxingu]
MSQPPSDPNMPPGTGGTVPLDSPLEQWSPTFAQQSPLLQQSPVMAQLSPTFPQQSPAVSVQQPALTPLEQAIVYLTDSHRDSLGLIQNQAEILAQVQQVLGRQTTPSSSAPRAKKISVAAPPSFDGNPKNYDAFITGVRIVFNADPDSYVNEASRVWYALSYMNKGIAAIWARRLIERVNKGDYQITTFTAFEKELKTTFGGAYKKADAQCALVNLRQDTQSAEDFFVEFEEHFAESGFNDETAIYYLHDNLNQAVVSKIYSQADVPTTYDEWKKLAIRLDRQYCERLMRAKGRATLPAAPSRPQASSYTWMPPVPTSSSGVEPGLGAPMDIGRQYTRGTTTQPSLTIAAAPTTSAPPINMSNVLCYNCRRFGHMGRDCPLPNPRRDQRTAPIRPTSAPIPGPSRPKTNVRQIFTDLTTDEKFELVRMISELAAVSVQPEEAPPVEPEGIEHSEVLDDAEDFQNADE